MKIRFDLYSPQILRDEIDFQLKKCGDAKTAAYMAIINLNQRYGVQDMQKARDISKLTRKQITDKRGHVKTVWVRIGEKPKEKEENIAEPLTEDESIRWNQLRNGFSEWDGKKGEYTKRRELTAEEQQEKKFYEIKHDNYLKEYEKQKKADRIKKIEEEKIKEKIKEKERITDKDEFINNSSYNKKDLEKFYNDIEHYINNGKYDFYGLRINSKNPKTGKKVKIKIGDDAKPSYYQPDGETTNISHGTSTLGLEDKNSITNVLKNLDKYKHLGDEIVLIGSNNAFGGNDPGELELKNGKILAILGNNQQPMQKATQLETGTKIESEHKRTIKFIKDSFGRLKRFPKDKEIFQKIASDHIDEIKDYYTRLIELEKQADKDKKRPDIEIDVIKFLIENPNPKDKEVHDFAESKGIDPDELEPVFYKLAKERAEMSKDMQKAKDTSKLIKKVIINKKGQQQTVYVAPEKKSSWMQSFMSFFNFKESRQVNQKLEADYKSLDLSSKGVTWSDWKDHVAEYFNNKDKWDRFFGKSQAEKKKAEKKEEKKAEKKDKKPSAAKFKLGLMKLIAGMYGEKPEVKQPVVEDIIESRKKEFQDIFEKIKIFERDKAPGATEQLIESRALNRMKEERSNLKNLERKNSLTEFINEKQNEYNQRYSVPEPVQSPVSQDDNFETMPEEETPEQKKEDKKIAKAINEATPEKRFEVEREITGVTKEAAEDVEIPIVAFQPKDIAVTIPFYKGGDAISVNAYDFTGVTARDIYLVKDKNILSSPKPSYIPEVDENYLRYSKFFLPTMKMGENKYIVRTHRASMMDTGEYAVVTRDVLAAMTDYYIKKAKAIQKKESEEYKAKTGRKLPSSRLSIMSESKMSYEQSNFMNSFTGRSTADWKLYSEIRKDLKQKTEDMEIQIEEYENTHAKGRETSYGDSGLKDNLFKDYGVKVKRQNGSEINDVEINEIKEALDTVYSAFGDRSSMAKSFGLKISHSGDVLMHARKAVGLFAPRMKAIGVSAKLGKTQFGFTLAHEWGHFMDYYVGEKEGKHYISDDPEHIAGQIAETFRKNMKFKQKSKYQTRTCECFARAMEQYWGIKLGEKINNIIGNHPEDDVFNEKLVPLIDQFFMENNELLKAFHKEFDNNKKIFIKKLNPETGKVEYRKVK